jgi:hypothetical protein
MKIGIVVIVAEMDGPFRSRFDLSQVAVKAERGP